VLLKGEIRLKKEISSSQQVFQKGEMEIQKQGKNNKIYLETAYSDVAHQGTVINKD
jgi:hypothetical protein